MDITIIKKENYGSTFYYPENRTAKTLCKAYNKKTFTVSQLKDLCLSFTIHLQVYSSPAIYTQLSKKDVSQLI